MLSKTFTTTIQTYLENICVDFMGLSKNTLNCQYVQIMPCPKITYAESHFEDGMRRGAMKGQNNSFILSIFYFLFLEGNKSFCSSAGLTQWEWCLRLWVRNYLKVHYTQHATEQLLLDKQGPPPWSSFPSTWSLIPQMSTWPVRLMFISHSFLKFNLR